MIWSDFEQPFRPNRDYAGFGPFVFERSTYDTAVAAIAEITSDSGTTAAGYG